eukprot:GEMP01045339.1.p1 GENE.GEMP01045339.1~~GEMP01045339.1.p1  ORF type:complete len:278 (+),score=51.22 GEMP01045339.1:387-1220(+)
MKTSTTRHASSTLRTRFANHLGDNDCMASIVAVQINADWMFLLTDVDCLYTDNPNVNPDAEPIREVRALEALNINTSTKGTDWGTGGMATKVAATRTCQCAGIHSALVNGSFPHRVRAYLHGDDTASRVGTYFVPLEVTQTMRDQRRWILSLSIRGTLLVDEGAAQAVAKKKSLFASGIRFVEGSFSAGEACLIAHIDTKAEIARALVNFSAEEVRLIKGLKSEAYAGALKSENEEVVAEVCHRRNIIFSTLSCNDADAETDDSHRRLSRDVADRLS